MSTYNRRSRKTKNAARKARKPRPRAKALGPSRSQRRQGQKLKQRPNWKARLASRKKGA